MYILCVFVYYMYTYHIYFPLLCIYMDFFQHMSYLMSIQETMKITKFKMQCQGSTLDRIVILFNALKKSLLPDMKP